MTQVRAVLTSGILRRFCFFRVGHGFGKAVADRALESVGRDGSGDFEVVLKKMQKETVFAKPFPFSKVKLRDELLVSLVRPHRRRRNAAG